MKAEEKDFETILAQIVSPLKYFGRNRRKTSVMILRQNFEMMGCVIDFSAQFIWFSVIMRLLFINGDS